MFVVRREGPGIEAQWRERNSPIVQPADGRQDGAAGRDEGPAVIDRALDLQKTLPCPFFRGSYLERLVKQPGAAHLAPSAFRLVSFSEVDG
jgi:hypothetical protein